MVKAECLAGRLLKTSHAYKCRKHKTHTKLCGKNEYAKKMPPAESPVTHKVDEFLLIQFARENPLCRSLNFIKFCLKSSKSKKYLKFIGKKSEVPEKWLKYFIDRINFTIDRGPCWWFRCKKTLKKAVHHILMKMCKCFKVKDMSKFISFIIKEDFSSYSDHRATVYSEQIINPTDEFYEGLVHAPGVIERYETMVALKDLHQVDFTANNMKKLLRNGYSKLAVSCKALLKRLNINGIRNANAYLHWLVDIENPLDILKPAKERLINKENERPEVIIYAQTLAEEIIEINKKRATA